MAVRSRTKSGPTQCGANDEVTRRAKDGRKPSDGQRMPGAGLSWTPCGKAPSERPAFQPYWGKLTVRNDRGDRGNVGIIRSPVRASILPDKKCENCATQRLSAHVKLFGRRPHEGLATRTGAGVRKAARDETARCLGRGCATRPAMGICTPPAICRRRGLPARRNGRPKDRARGLAFEAVAVRGTMVIVAILPSRMRQISEFLRARSRASTNNPPVEIVSRPPRS